VVAEIGEEHVIQVITDNHASYVNAGARLVDTRKYLYWTPYDFIGLLMLLIALT